MNAGQWDQLAREFWPGWSLPSDSASRVVVPIDATHVTWRAGADQFRIQQLPGPHHHPRVIEASGKPLRAAGLQRRIGADQRVWPGARARRERDRRWKGTQSAVCFPVATRRTTPRCKLSRRCRAVFPAIRFLLTIVPASFDRRGSTVGGAVRVFPHNIFRSWKAC